MSNKRIQLLNLPSISSLCTIFIPTQLEIHNYLNKFFILNIKDIHTDTLLCLIKIKKELNIFYLISRPRNISQWQKRSYIPLFYSKKCQCRVKIKSGTAAVTADLWPFQILGHFLHSFMSLGYSNKICLIDCDISSLVITTESSKSDKVLLTTHETEYLP